MARCRADRADDTLAHPGQNRLLAGTTDQPVDVGAHSHSGHRQQLNPILGHRRDLGGGDHLGIDADLHRLEDVTPGKVDRRRLLERKRDAGLVGRDEGIDHPGDVAPGEVMRLQLVDAERQAGLGGGDQWIDDAGRIDLAEPHPDQRHERDSHTRGRRPDPQPDRDVAEKDDERQEGEDEQNQQCGESSRFFGHELCISLRR